MRYMRKPVSVDNIEYRKEGQFMSNFALIGAAGFVAPRHMKAIQQTGNVLVAVLDRNDSVGIIDSYYPDADFFTEFERFDRHLEMLRRKNKDQAVEYVSIASPNYLHDAHVRFALRIGAHAICEKPLVLNPWNLDALSEAESEFGRKIFSVLQLRLHPEIIKLKQRIDSTVDEVYDIDLTYITSRGRWYYRSWKGDEEKSGGIATNIGVHFFDMLSWVFGPYKKNIVHLLQPDRASGYLELQKARVRWFMSLNRSDIPEEARAAGKRTYRLLRIDGQPFDFTDGFESLHTRLYEEVLRGNGFTIEDNRQAIEIVHGIRQAVPQPNRAELHPFLVPNGKMRYATGA
jgi:UDP-N-acetyl-2-amino-2-deoxyglucuronate dehydrogenase